MSRHLLPLWRRGRPEPSEREQAELAELFRARYHAFRMLLAANNKALAVMAEMERAATGDSVFGMSFVHSHCTAAGVSVYQMVRHLDSLAPGKYSPLGERLDAIRLEIQELLEARTAPPGGALVVPLEAVDVRLVDQAGPKLANLGEIRRAVGLAVPDGFVITASAFQRFLDHNQLQPEIDRLIQASTAERTDELFALSSQLQQLIISAEVPTQLSDAIAGAYRELTRRLDHEPRLVLRSSALGEDSPDASFAGQYRSQLNVRGEHLLDAYRDVVASKYTPQAMHYRLQRGLRDDQIAMCVGCLAMIDARAGGVAYTGNPNDSRDDDVHVTAALGLPATVVDGRFSSDQYRVRRGDPPALVSRDVAFKTARLVARPSEGVTREGVPRQVADRPALADDEVVELARQTLLLEDHFGGRQDVEWAAAEDGQLYILQARPLRQRDSSPPVPAPDATADATIASGGVAASLGAACGTVHWVRRDSDALGFPDGGVLVLSQPLPRWAALLGRAAAVVAEEGSMAGHLATVAREFRVPALLGVGRSVRTLADGDVVTVDAGGQAVYRGRQEQLLGGGAQRTSLMAGSPVHDTLLGALERIAPLTLLDPDALSFRPANCRTLHDITRFCHEQAVREMFEFGRDQRFPEHAAKQLHHNVPMQWWLLDLEDGFTGEVSGKYVRLHEIASVPMLAIWNGMVAVPWEGPPAATGRGLASVLFEATTNPALATPFRKPYAQRNYFMISSHFMNLQSRFGFHFSAVESLAGPRPEENYIAFSFKGGAADRQRRSSRIRLIADFLEELDFAVTVVHDTATARIAGLSAPDTAQRLRIIGYLLMHTRQLDVIMGDPAAVRYYRDKIRSDIAGLASSEPATRAGDPTPEVP
jgi:pyruvate,water dikinase